MPLPIALDIFTDLSGFVRDWLWVIAAIVGFVAVMVYLIAYLSRYFEYLKMQESKYLDRGTLDFVHRVLEWVWIGILVVVIMGIASVRSPEVKALLTEFIQRFPSVIFVIFTLFVAAVLVRALRRFGAYLRGELRTKPRQLAQPRLWGAVELFLKYVIIGVALLVAFVGAVDSLPPTVPEKEFLQGLRNSVTAPSSQLFAALAIAAVGGILAYGLGRFSETIFVDVKKRSRHGPQVVDQFRAVTRFIVYGLFFVIILFLELSVFLSQSQIIVFAVVFLMAVIGLVLISFDSLRNAFAGLTLMMSDPFSVKDRVKIGDDLVGEVKGITLTMTQIETGRGELVTLPNRQVLQQSVLNFTRSEHHPIIVDVSIGWEVPHKTVEELLIEAARRTPGIVESPPPQVFGKDVEGNAIVHQLLAYTNDPEQMKQVKSALVYTVQDLFHERKLKALASAR